MSLKPLLEAQFFPYVIRPARYIGNELGTIHKHDPGLCRIVIAVPDKYDVGMSHPPLHSLYQSINRLDDAVCERIFAPDLDAEALLRAKQIPLFSLESFKPLTDFHIVLFLLPGELCLTNVLTILEIGGLPIWNRDRTNGQPLIGAVAPLCFNPEPIADFLDFFFVGEIEESVSEIVQAQRENSSSDRKQRLKRLSAISGVYVPSLYQKATSEGQPSRLEKTEPSAPDSIRARMLTGKEASPPISPIVPFEEIARDHLSVEITRGVGHNCRFCPAPVYRSRREREINAVVNQVEAGLQQTGYDEVTLLGNSSYDYKHFDILLSALADRLRDRQVRFNLPLLGSNGRFLDSAKRLSAPARPALAFAIEAGSERLREMQGRYFATEVFYQLVANALAAGWHSLRLSFLVGLPTETDDDLAAIVDIVRNCDDIGRECGGKATLHVNIAPFVPRAHTPWQWEESISIEEYSRKVEYLRRSLRGRNIQFKSRASEPAFLEAVLARGDRRLSEVINRAYQLGVRFDNSAEHFDFARWQQAFSDCAMTMTEFTRRRSPQEALPWEHLDKGLSKEQLRREAERLSQPSEMPIPRSGGFKLGDLFMLKPEIAEQVIVHQSATNVGFGRKPKRVAEAANMVVPRSRVRMAWSKGEGVRFVGHLATMRVFERAVRRAEVPVDYTQGFHRRQKLSFGPPLAVGFTAGSEYLDLQLVTPFREEMIARLNQVLPEGFHVYQGKPVFGKATSLSSLINLACYEVVLGDSPVVAQAQIDEVLGRDSIVIRRCKDSEVKEAEVRNSVFKIELHWRDGVNLLYMELAMGSLGFIKPDEVLEQCFSIPEPEVLRLRICRIDLLVIHNTRRLTPFEVD
jgi:radical SAM family uncharacterized protein/radical SAM-linked protein